MDAESQPLHYLLLQTGQYGAHPLLARAKIVDPNREEWMSLTGSNLRVKDDATYERYRLDLLDWRPTLMRAPRYWEGPTWYDEKEFWVPYIADATAHFAGTRQVDAEWMYAGVDESGGFTERVDCPLPGRREVRRPAAGPWHRGHCRDIRLCLDPARPDGRDLPQRIRW